MSLRKLGMATAAVLVVGVVSTGSAIGAVETKAAQWYLGPTAAGVTTLAGSQAITTEIAEHPVIGKKVEKVTTIARTKLRVVATAFSCVECVMENREVTGKVGKVAYGSGKLKMTGATLIEPAGVCTISSPGAVTGEIVTKQIVIHGDWRDTTPGNERPYLQFIPAAGTSFWTIELKGASCAIAGLYNITGSLFGELKSNLGTMSTSQELVMSPVVQATTGAQLNLGANPVTLTGTGKVSAAGKFFGLK
jgi:hypothetical protein